MSAPGAHSESILVIDDEVQIRRALTTILETRGYEVACAESGATAIDALTARTPDESAALPAGLIRGVTYYVADGAYRAEVSGPGGSALELWTTHSDSGWCYVFSGELVERRVGALIVFERKTGLTNYIEKGVRIDAVVQQETLVSIFLPGSPLHDGAVIIQEGRIAAAGCILPLDASIEISGTFGTRHRCGLSLSKETDAVVIIVSEERGTIALAFDGTMRLNLSEQVLRDTLLKLLPSGKWMLKRV